MNLDGIIGNDDVKRAFRSMAATGRVPHALLLHENEGGGALPLVLGFIELLTGNTHYEWNTHFSFPISSGTKVSGAVKDLTCDDFSKYWRELLETNPYFLENELSAALGIEKKSGVIAVAEGKSILQKLSLSGDGYRFMVIWLPEKMNPQTANMLLKSIEEPSEQTVFILVTHSPEDVLLTISSRCQHMRVLPLSTEEVVRTLVEQRGVDPESAAEAAAYADGSVGMALQYLSGAGDAGLFQDLFTEMIGNLTDRKLGAVLEVGEALRKIFLLQQGMEAVASIPPQEEAFYKDAAARLGKTFCRKALDILGRTARLLERNVGQKILFCNMMTRLWASV